MLESYVDEQKYFVDEIRSVFDNNKLSHAYLIETRNYLGKDELILDFIKEIFFSSKNVNGETRKEISNLIDRGMFSDFLSISPDGSWIKKDQVLEIKEKFKTTSTNSLYRVYLIKDADKLNKQAANSLLKFLEEPDGKVIAILETDNRYKVMETIRSRCQILSLINKKVTLEEVSFELVGNFIDILEKKKVATIAFLPMILGEVSKSKEEFRKVLEYLMVIYEKALRKILDVSSESDEDFIDSLNLIVEKNTANSLIKKIEVIYQHLNRLEYNLNLSLMFDKFIIDFNGGEDCYE